VKAADLLADLPSGWTLDGPLPPDTPTTVTGKSAAGPQPPAADHSSSADAASGPVDEPVPTERAGSPRAEPVTTLVAQPQEPVTSLVVQPPTHLGTPPSGLTPPSGVATPTVTPPKARRTKPPKKKRRARRVVVLLVLLLLAGGAGTLWVASMLRTVTGVPTAGPGRDGGAPPFDWSPTIVGPCSQAEISEIREGADGRERCQRTSDRNTSWVREPEQGFPISNPEGPFPTETCDVEGDTDYSPIGERVVCTEAVWTVTN
jgi:hypothetical protein